MPGFEDTAVIVILALLLFGPKKLPVLARQLGKLMADFRRASNEFRSQMEEELRISEQADRQKQVAAIQAAAPPTPALEASTQSAPEYGESTTDYPQDYSADSPTEAPADTTSAAAAEPSLSPESIATSGELSIMPPSTGLPVPNHSPASTSDVATTHESELETETLHG
jgi:sec-independent protein translocase protein TatB